MAQLCEPVAQALPSANCTLLADRGLSSLPLVRLCQQQGWHFVLRIKPQEWLRCRFRHTYRDWQPGVQVVERGEHWYGQIVLWKEHQEPFWLSGCWEKGEQEAWVLISDQVAGPKRVSQDAKRMSTEASFQDEKSRGCCIQASRFRQHDHLNRWLLVVALALWCLAHPGRSCIHHGQRQQFDRTDRRDKGLFRLGRLWLRFLLKQARADLGRQLEGIARARLANALPFSHRQARLCFCISLR